jgi:hypothetical protein
MSAVILALPACTMHKLITSGFVFEKNPFIQIGSSQEDNRNSSPKSASRILIKTTIEIVFFYQKNSKIQI